MNAMASGTILGGDAFVVDRVLRLRTPQATVDVPLVALRDRCTCVTCRHPSGQRLLDPATISLESRPAQIDVDGDDLRITWWPDDHRSAYSLKSLLSPPTDRATS